MCTYDGYDGALQAENGWDKQICGHTGFIYFVSNSISLLTCHLYYQLFTMFTISNCESCVRGTVLLYKLRFIILHHNYTEMSYALSELYCVYFFIVFCGLRKHPVTSPPYTDLQYMAHCIIGCWLLLCHWFVEGINHFFWLIQPLKSMFVFPAVHFG